MDHTERVIRRWSRHDAHGEMVRPVLSSDWSRIKPISELTPEELDEQSDRIVDGFAGPIYGLDGRIQ